MRSQKSIDHLWELYYGISACRSTPTKHLGDDPSPCQVSFVGMGSAGKITGRQNHWQVMLCNERLVYDCALNGAKNGQEIWSLIFLAFLRLTVLATQAVMLRAKRILSLRRTFLTLITRSWIGRLKRETRRQSYGMPKVRRRRLGMTLTPGNAPDYRSHRERHRRIGEGVIHRRNNLGRRSNLGAEIVRLVRAVSRVPDRISPAESAFLQSSRVQEAVTLVMEKFSFTVYELARLMQFSKKLY